MLNGNNGYGHHLTLRSSVAMGIRHVYKQHEEKKWRHVLETARQILDGDSMVELESEPRNHGRATTMKQTAPQWSILFNIYITDLNKRILRTCKMGTMVMVTT